MHEEHRNALGVVGLEEVDARPHLPQEAVDLEVAEPAVLPTEARIGQVGDLAVHRHLAHAHEQLLLVGAKTSRPDLLRDGVEVLEQPRGRIDPQLDPLPPISRAQLEDPIQPGDGGRHRLVVVAVVPVEIREGAHGVAAGRELGVPESGLLENDVLGDRRLVGDA